MEMCIDIVVPRDPAIGRHHAIDVGGRRGFLPEGGRRPDIWQSSGKQYGALLKLAMVPRFGLHFRCISFPCNAACRHAVTGSSFR